MPVAWDEFSPVEPEQSKWDEFEPVEPAQRPAEFSEEEWKAAQAAMAAPDWKAAEANYNRIYRPPTEPDEKLSDVLAESMKAEGTVMALPAKALSLVPRPTAQQVQDAFDVVRNPLDLAAPSRPPSEAAKVTAGVANVGRGVAESLVSPLGVATMGTGALPGAAGRAVSGAFLADMARHVPEQARAAGAASVEGDTQEKVEAFGNLAVTPVMSAAIGLHAAGPRMPAEVRAFIDKSITQGETIGLKKSAAAAAKTEVPDASAVRENTGQLPEARKVTEGSEAPRGDDVQQVAPGQPEPVAPRAPEVPQEIAGRVAAMTAEEVLTFSKEVRARGSSPTQEAYALGRETTTPEQLAKLKEHEAAAKKEFDAALEAENVDVLSPLAAKKQFFTEAIEEAVGAAQYKGKDVQKFNEKMAAGIPERAPQVATADAAGRTVAEPPAVDVSETHTIKTLAPAGEGAESFSYTDFYDAYKRKNPEPKNPQARIIGGMMAPESKLKGVRTTYKKKATAYNDARDAAFLEHFNRELEAGNTPDIYQVKDAARMMAGVGRLPEAEALLKRFGFVKKENHWADPPEGSAPTLSKFTQGEPAASDINTGVGEAGAIATAGPPLMPAPPAGAPRPVKPISQVIRDLAKGLDIPIRFGRLTTNKYAGYFKKNPNLIGAKFANDMPIVAHEVGHKVDTIYPFTRDTSLHGELNALGDPAVAGSRSSWTPSKSKKYKLGEGLAEFVRHWMTDPAEAQRLAPDTYKVFENVLNGNEDLGRVMRQSQTDIKLWREAPAEARLDSSISRSDPNGSRYTVSNLTRDVVDDLHFLRLAVDDAQKLSGPLPPSRNPYLLARTLRGSYGMADNFIRKGVADFNSREVKLGTSLEDALKPVSGRVDEFRRWIVAKRAQEMATQGKKTGLNPADVDFVADKYNADPQFNEAFTKIKEWNDALLQYAVDAGLVSEKSAGAMREMNQDYVPFHRIFEVGAGESPAVQGGGTGKGLNVGKPSSLRGASGSQRDIVDPLETMVKNAYSLITAAEKNAINTSVADLANKTDMGRWVEKIGAPKEAVKVEVDRIRSQLEANGADMTNVPDEVIVQFFRPSGRAPFGENVIKVNRGENLEFYRLDKDLFDTFHALDMDSSSRLLKMLSLPAQVLRAGVTLTPDFALSNAMRDTVSGSIISKYTDYPFQATIKGMAALLNNPKLVAEWAASGGKQSVEASYFDRAKLQQFLSEKITKDMTAAERATVWLKSPLTALRLFTGTLEEATRLGEYQNAYKKLTAQGMSPAEARRQAAFEARDLQDFAKGGAQTKIVRSLAAFWNAGLQGNVRLAQAFKQRPLQTTMKGLAFVTLPKLLEQALNWNDEDYWDRPQWERDLFFLIPRGKDANGHTQFVRIPTPFEVGVIFGTFPGRVLQALREEDPEAMKGFPQVMLRQTIPNPLPQSVMTLVEASAGKSGYSFFRGRPIVPQSIQNAPPEMQFTLQNSLTSKKVGNLLGVAPAKVDYVIGGMTGGVGRQLTHQVADRAISAVTGEERTARSTTPGARFVATPAGTQSESIERFYKALEEANADQERVKAGGQSKGQARFATRLEAASREIATLRRAAQEEKDEDRRQAIQLQMAAKAKAALQGMK